MSTEVTALTISQADGGLAGYLVPELMLPFVIAGAHYSSTP